MHWRVGLLTENQKKPVPHDALLICSALRVMFCDCLGYQRTRTGAFQDCPGSHPHLGACVYVIVWLAAEGIAHLGCKDFHFY